MNRRQSIFSIITSTLSLVLFKKNKNKQVWTRIDSNGVNGWECRTSVFKQAVVLDHKDFKPYKTLDPCECITRTFVPDKGESYELPAVIPYYKGFLVDMGTNEITHSDNIDLSIFASPKHS